MAQNSNLVPAQENQNRSMASRSGQGIASSDYNQSPWTMMRRMQEDMDRVFGQFFGGGIGRLPQFNELDQWSPNMDISQTEKEWNVEADLPGVKQEDIYLELRDHYLILRAELKPEETEKNERRYHQRERRYGYFERVLPLPDNVNEEAVSCDFKDGVLKVHLPKTEAAINQPRRIPIGQQSAGQTSATGQTAAAGQKAMTGQQPTTAAQSAGVGSGANGNKTDGSREPVGAGAK